MDLQSQVKTFPLWQKGDIPNFQNSIGKEDTELRDIIFIKNVQQATLEVFLPSERNANGMAILICPGGGYSGVAYDWEGIDIAKWFNSRGIAAFVLKYRMPQAESVLVSYEAPIQDAQRAIRYIRHHADRYHINKDRVGVIGFSAGGHLASTLGTHFEQAYYEGKDSIDTEKIRPDFMMLIYPVISMQKDITHNGSRNKLLGENPSDTLMAQFSNELRATKETPPTFLLHSGDDGAVPVENSIRFYQALLKNGVDVSLHLYPHGGHGYSMGLSRKGAPHWASIAEEWLENLNVAK